MAWPDRVVDAASGCDWTSAATWDFFPLDEEAFPAVQIARRAGIAGGTAPAVFNGADEACVESFLAGRIPFTAIVDTIAEVLDEHLAPGSGEWVSGNSVTLDDVLHADTWARARAAKISGG
jgi:1-deoxy-D-xylulose-5-phosphate reductoisomerase